MNLIDKYSLNKLLKNQKNKEFRSNKLMIKNYLLNQFQMTNKNKN